MVIGLAQINSHLGNFEYNFELIKKNISEASKNNVDILVFPELALFGYHPLDLLERREVVTAQQKYIKKIEAITPAKMCILIGAIFENKKRGKPFYNSVYLFEKGKKTKLFHKELHPSYDVFDDLRHFEIGKVVNNRFSFKGKNVQVLICEDMWGWDDVYINNPITQVKQKTDLVINLSASPFYLGKKQKRKAVAEKTVKYFKCPLVYVNLIGAQDELIFDGGSFVMDKNGKYLVSPLGMEEKLTIFSHETPLKPKNFTISEVTELKEALVLGIRDFVNKAGFQKVHLGSSGGIDSALVICLAADALGPKNVHSIYMPSEFSANLSLTLSKELSKNIGCGFDLIEINNIYSQILKDFQNIFGDFSFGLTNENLQSRIRGLLLMTYSNQYNSLLLTTGNKSEYATGYATIYGDMCGGLAPLGDLLKRQVYDLARFYEKRGWMPKGIINREPSAELRPNQKDSDSLPNYNELDKAVDNIVNKKKKALTEVEKWLAQRLMKSEFKRWQAAPILKVSEHAFGLGRRFPIAHKAYY